MDAGRDQSVASDRPADRPVVAEAGRDQSVAGDRPADRPVDASRDAGGVCSPLDLTKPPVSDAGVLGTCEPTWSAVLAHPVCWIDFVQVESRGDCGPYHVRHIGVEVDVEDLTCYYDISSGMLVAIYTESTTVCTGPPGTNLRCLCSGPPGGIAPECLNPTLTPFCAADGAIIDRGLPDGGTRG
jgi:hypothetical protein